MLFRHRRPIIRITVEGGLRARIDHNSVGEVEIDVRGVENVEIIENTSTHHDHKWKDHIFSAVLSTIGALVVGYLLYKFGWT